MKFYYTYDNGVLILDIPKTVYYPQEDSIFFADTIRRYLKSHSGLKKILDVGCGSGFLGILISKLTGSEIFCVDVNEDAVKTTKKNAKKNGAKLCVLKSNLFEKIEDKFDLIIFNPPYIPVEDKNVMGRNQWSDPGLSTIKRFVKTAKNYLSKKGRILMLISSITGEKEVVKFFKDNNFKVKIFATKKIPWEKLLIIEAQRKNKI